jgi:type II secretory pathway component GspD/PulD (secretin)
MHLMVSAHMRLSLLALILLGSGTMTPVTAEEPPAQRPPQSFVRLGQFDTPLLRDQGGSSSRQRFIATPSDEATHPLPPPRPTPSVQQPSSAGRLQIPVAPPSQEGTIRIQQNDDTISLFVRDASLQHVLSMVAKASGLNIVVSEQAAERISITLNHVPFEDALDAILTIGGYTWTNRNNILFVSKLKGTSAVPARLQGRAMEVFTLDYAAASDVQAAIQGMLSPAGNSSILQSDPADQRRTREAVVIEDVAEVIERVAHYVERIDTPPRQVMIEAHILQVDLSDTLKHGVNIQRLAESVGGDISLDVRGFADAAAGQGFVATIDGNDMGAVIDALKTTTETKTLAAPKVLVINGQDAHLQVGEQLAYRTTLTTQTATQETIQFLPVGVVLDVRPQISRDGRILMFVKPKVSSGRINPDNQLPEERKTEVETNVLLEDGEGLVIGGLIQELASNDQSKIPILGDLPKVGLLFQRRAKELTRSEIIVTLIPRIVPLDHGFGQPDEPPYYSEQHRLEYERANTPLTRGSLYRNPRYHLEDPMPDACDHPVMPCELCGQGQCRCHHYSAPPQSAAQGFWLDDTGCAAGTCHQTPTYEAGHEGSYNTYDDAHVVPPEPYLESDGHIQQMQFEQTNSRPPTGRRTMGPPKRPTYSHKFPTRYQPSPLQSQRD